MIWNVDPVRSIPINISNICLAAAFFSYLFSSFNFMTGKLFADAFEDARRPFVRRGLFIVEPRQQPPGRVWSRRLSGTVGLASGDGTTSGQTVTRIRGLTDVVLLAPGWKTLCGRRLPWPILSLRKWVFLLLLSLHLTIFTFILFCYQRIWRATFWNRGREFASRHWHGRRTARLCWPLTRIIAFVVTISMT